MLMGVRVLLADDHAMLRDALRMVLEAQDQIAIVGEAEDGTQAVELAAQLRPDVVVMDIAMPNMSGLDATRQIKRRFPEVRVVILTMHETRQYLTQIAEAGATGAVLKRSAAKDLITAVRAASRGERYFAPSIEQTTMHDYQVHRHSENIDRREQLTERESEILQLIAEGRSNQEVADSLAISIKTVQTHRAHIIKKLDLHDRVDLVKYAIRAGLVSS